MDDGYVIPRLNEEWTFAGATVMEWCSGVVSAMMFHEIFTDGKANSVPLVVMIMMAVPVCLSTLRKTFPDEERGLRNYLMVCCGAMPPDLPPCSKFQPMWSGMPIRELNANREFVQLGLEEVLAFRPPEIDEGQEA